MAVAMVALDAVVQTRGPKRARSIPLVDFHLVPGNTPERETVLQHGELIVAVDLPASNFARRSLKLWRMVQPLSKPVPKILALADQKSPLYGSNGEDVIAENGSLFLKNKSSATETYGAILGRHKLKMIEARADGKPGEEKDKYSEKVQTC